MKNSLKKVLSVFAVSSLLLLPLTAQEMNGRQIVEKAEDANASKEGLVTKGTLELKDLKKNSSERRGCTILSLTEAGKKKAVFRFTDSSYKGTTFLSLEQDDKSKIQYIFLSSVGSPRQVESSDKEKNFVDTDMTNEELGGSNLDDFNYDKLPDTKVDGKDCFVVEKKPKKADSKYSKHVLAIDKQTWIPLQVKSYDKNGRLFKTINASDVRKVGATLNVPYRLEFTAVVDQHQTIVTVSESKETKINKGVFEKNRMKAEWPY